MNLELGKKYLNIIELLNIKFNDNILNKNYENAFKNIIKMRKLHGKLINKFYNLLDNKKNYFYISCIQSTLLSINNIIILCDSILIKNNINYLNDLNKINFDDKLKSSSNNSIVDISNNKILPVSDLSNNKILLVSDLSNNKVLPVSNLSNNKILPVSDLSNNKVLPVSNLSNNKVLPVSNLYNNKILPVSDLSNNKILSISDISNNKILSISDISNNKILPVSNLSNNKVLPVSDLSNNKVLPVSKLSNSDIINQENKLKEELYKIFVKPKKDTLPYFEGFISNNVFNENKYINKITNNNKFNLDLPSLLLIYSPVCNACIYTEKEWNILVTDIKEKNNNILNIMKFNIDDKINNYINKLFNIKYVPTIIMMEPFNKSYAKINKLIGKSNYNVINDFIISSYNKFSLSSNREDNKLLDE